MRRMWKAGLAVAVLFIGSALADDLVITTWNIENIGADDGRGFAGGFGRGNLDPRTDTQLEDIADLIRDTLKSDIVAIQEVVLTHRTSAGVPRPPCNSEVASVP